MATERIILMGKLEERKLAAMQLRLRMTGMRDSIRLKLDKYEALERLDLAVATAEMLELAAQQEIYRELLDEIAALKRDLGTDA